MKTKRRMNEHNSLKRKCHTLILGHTGSGKTYYAMLGHFLSTHKTITQYSKVTMIGESNIFFDSNMAAYEPEYQRAIRHSRFPVVMVTSYDEFTDAFQAGARWIIVEPDPGAPPSVWRTLVDDILHLVRMYQASIPPAQRHDTWLYFDEVSKISEKVKESEVSGVFTRGRAMRMYGIGISQRAPLVSRDLIDESNLVILYWIRPEQMAAMARSYAMTIPDDVKKHLATRYAYATYDGKSWKKYQPFGGT